MGTRAMILGLGLTAALLLGCGGSSHKTTSTTSSVGTSPTTTASTKDPALTHRLLTSSEMPSGFSAQGPSSVSTTIAQWLQGIQTAPAQVGSETARYKRIGFVAAATQQLSGPGGAGVSLVEQFRSPAGARSELAHDLATFDGGPANRTNFSLPGVPHSGGFAGPGSGAGVNVVFADGDYYYLVGEQPNAAANRAGVIAAAQKLYHRVRG